MATKQSNEQRYYDTLKRIAKYESVERLRKHGESEYGISAEEAIEYAYENVLQEAKSALRGRRRPKD